MRLLGVVLLLLACEASPNSHRRIHEARDEPVYAGCWADNGGPPVTLFENPDQVELYLECAGEADRLIPEAGEYWACRADEMESAIECLETLGCDSETWETCTASACTPLSEQVELDWTCTELNCEYDAGRARPTSPNRPCEGWSPPGG